LGAVFDTERSAFSGGITSPGITVTSAGKLYGAPEWIIVGLPPAGFCLKTVSKIASTTIISPVDGSRATP